MPLSMQVESLEDYFNRNIDGVFFIKKDNEIIGFSNVKVGLEYLSEQSDCVDTIKDIMIDILMDAPKELLEQSDYYDTFNVDGQINWNLVANNLFQDKVLYNYAMQQITIDDLKDICINADCIVFNNKDEAMDDWVENALEGYEADLVEY